MFFLSRLVNQTLMRFRRRKRAAVRRSLGPPAGRLPALEVLEDRCVPSTAVPSLSINDVSVVEGNSGTVNAVFAVRLSAPSATVVSVAFATANGTARALSDYQPVKGSLIFAPGQTDQMITVPVKGDTLGEANETFEVDLTHPVDATIADGQGVGIILNDDPTPAFTNRSVTPVINEGAVATLQGTISMPSPQDTFLLQANWGDDTPIQTVTFPAGSNGQIVQLTHVYANSSPTGTYTVHAAWQNQFGGGNSADFLVTVNNVAPTVDAGPDVVLGANGVLHRQGSFTDPGTDTWTATVDYGDGQGAQPLHLEGKDFHLHHHYQAPGSYVVTVTVSDNDGGTGVDQFTVTVPAPIHPEQEALPDAQADEGLPYRTIPDLGDPNHQQR
jgi:hypothetical protein